jgi:hypothetical protein
MMRMLKSDIVRPSHHLAFLAVLVCLGSCDKDPFGPDLREIAGGYRLKRTGDPREFALLIPYQSGGLIVDEIGWRKPIIVARGSGSDYWDVINTARAQHTTVSDAQRKSDPVYQSIAVTPVDIAWRELQANKRLW